MNFIALASGAGLLLLFGLFARTYARSLRPYFSLPGKLATSPQAIRSLFAGSAVGGVSVGLAVSHLILAPPLQPIAPVLVSLAVVLPLQFLMARRTLKEVRV
jgi:hypothetical protein